MSQEKNTAYNVQCPQCSATLKVSDTRKTYLCPVCSKLINIRLMRKYTTPVDEEVENLAVACTDEKLDEHLETAAEVATPTPPVQVALQEENLEEAVAETVQLDVAQANVEIAGEDSKAQKLEIPFSFEDAEEVEADTDRKDMDVNAGGKKKFSFKKAATSNGKEKCKVRNAGELIFYSCLIALPLLQLLIFYVYVNFNSVFMSFQSYDTLTNKFTWDFGVNFVRLWSEVKSSILIDALINSVAIWFWTSLFGKFLSILFSYYIYKKWAMGTLFKFFLFLPTILPGILLVLMFKFFVNEAIPGYALELFGKTITPLLIGEKSLMPTLIFFNIWTSFGGQVLIYTGAMDQLAPEVMEAGQVDGVTPIQEFFYLVIPMIMPTIATFMIASVAGLFTNQASLYSFFGENSVDYSNYTIGYYLFILVSKSGNGKTMYTYASALGLVCTFIAFPLTLLMRRVLVGKED